MPWELWRQDDHGNEFLIRACDDRDEAEEAQAAFEARGHHQHYWVVERAAGPWVRSVEDGERAWLAETLAARWGQEVVGRGRSWRPAELDALVAVENDERTGVATFVVEGDEAELVTLDALVPGRGAGRALVEAVIAAARGAGARRLRVMTTNDNLRALRLYQHAGFRLEALRPGAVDAARDRKPSIPLSGAEGLPIRDEIDLVVELGPTRAPTRAAARSPRPGSPPSPGGC